MRCGAVPKFWSGPPFFLAPHRGDPGFQSFFLHHSKTRGTPTIVRLDGWDKMPLKRFMPQGLPLSTAQVKCWGTPKADLASTLYRATNKHNEQTEHNQRNKQNERNQRNEQTNNKQIYVIWLKMLICDMNAGICVNLSHGDTQMTTSTYHKNTKTIRQYWSELVVFF